MIRIAAYIAAGVAIGLGLAFWHASGPEPAAFAPGLVADGRGAERGAAERGGIEQRLSALETRLRLEQFEREQLAAELAELRAGGLTPVGATGDSRTEPGSESVPVTATERFPEGLPDSRAEIERTLEQRQIDRFVEAGFAPARASWLLTLEDELEMQALQSRYEARQDGATDHEIANMTVSRLMRQTLGDGDYEKYLAGQGRPTSVSVREVLGNSPAQAAGLQAGDEIIEYNGERIFEMAELSRLTDTAKPGSTVVVEVERDGQRVQFYVAGGPLGISGGGRSRRDFTGGR